MKKYNLSEQLCECLLQFENIWEENFSTNGRVGSKGIGKYASFVASSFNTVFYSTYICTIL